MLSKIIEFAANLLKTPDEALSEYSPTLLIIGTIASMLFIQKMQNTYQRWDTAEIKKTLLNKTVHTLQHLPYFGPQITAEIDKEVSGILTGIKSDVDKARAEWQPIETLPEKGLSEEKIKDRFKNLQAHYQAGKLSGGVYAEYDKKTQALLEFVWGKTALTNPMHSEWPLINLMEAEVISMCQNLLHGEAGAPGLMTHGGSTSILEACKTYVFHAREKGIEQPEIIVPDTAHVSFDKAAKILNAKLIKVPVDKLTGAADVKAMEKAINKRTCMMVGSAPSFPCGIMDPIAELGQIALKHHIPLHVDACLGGFLTVFAKDAGFNLPPCDFSVPGVNSISIDTHKYGQTPKGTSVLLFHKNTPATPTHTHLQWKGGMYVTPGVDGSRNGADIATAWAVLCFKGARKYIEETQQILSLQRKLVEEINKMKGIYVPYQPMLSVIPIESEKGINILLIADRLKQAGWSVIILQTSNQNSSGLHFCLTSVHTHQENFHSAFLQDLSAAVKYAKANPKEKPNGMAKAYGKLEKSIPAFIQDRIGEGYTRILNTLPNIAMWTKPQTQTANSVAAGNPAMTVTPRRKKV